MAKILPCRACGNQVSADARACPKCGAPRKRSRVLPVLIVVVGVFVVIAAASGGKTRDKERARASEPAIEVSAEQLHRDYKANEVSADERYRGKMLIVSGSVKAIKKDILDDPYVELSTSNEFESVDAHFGEPGGLGSLSPGAVVTVRCVGNNVMIGRPQLKECVLQ